MNLLPGGKLTPTRASLLVVVRADPNAQRCRPPSAAPHFSSLSKRQPEVRAAARKAAAGLHLPLSPSCSFLPLMHSKVAQIQSRTRV